MGRFSDGPKLQPRGLEAGQPTFPWRGRITCSPAAGYAGSVDKTATAASQVATFFGSADPSDFAISGETVSWTGPSGDWGLRRMMLHYAHLCAVAGGVDAFLIGGCIQRFIRFVVYKPYYESKLFKPVL